MELLLCFLMVVVLSSGNPLEKRTLQSSKVLVNVEIDELKGLLSVDINPEVTVGELMRTIYRQWKQEENSWYSDEDVDRGINFNDVEMEANKTLSHYNIHEGATVHLMSPQRSKRSKGGFFLSVIMPHGHPLTDLDVFSSTKVMEVKKKISKKTHYSPEVQELFVREEKMKDNKSLDKYGICKESTIRLKITQDHKADKYDYMNDIRKIYPY